MHSIYNRLEVLSIPFRFKHAHLKIWFTHTMVFSIPNSSVEASLLLGVSPGSIFGHTLIEIAQVTDDTVTTFVSQECPCLTNVITVLLKCCIN